MSDLLFELLAKGRTVEPTAAAGIAPGKVSLTQRMSARAAIPEGQRQRRTAPAPALVKVNDMKDVGGANPVLKLP